MRPDHGAGESPATLVAIIVAARRTGDRDLERTARRRLEAEFGVKLGFLRERTEQAEAPHHVS